MRIFLTAACIMIAIVTTAQPVETRTPAQIYWQKEAKKYNEDYIKGIQSGSNKTVKTSGNGTVNNDAAKQLADQWKRNRGQIPEGDKEYWRLKALVESNRLQAIEESKRAAREWNLQERQRMLYIQELDRKNKAIADRQTALREKYLALGFTPAEASNLAWNASNSFRTQEALQRLAPKVYAAVDAFEAFEKQKQTAVFEKLAPLVKQFEIASYSAVKAYQLLAERFPDKYLEADKGQIEALYHFYGGGWEVLTEHQFSITSPARRRELDSLFFSLLDRHGDLALAACRSGNRKIVPLDEWFNSAKAAGNTAEAIHWATLGMRVPYDGIYNWNNSPGRMFSDFLKSQPGFLESQSVEFWIRAGKNPKGGAVEVLRSLYGIGKLSLTQMDIKKGDIIHEKSADAFIKQWTPLIRELADSGDASGLNAWAVLIAKGKVKKIDEKESLKIFEKAAAAGSIEARINLCLLARTPIGGSLSEAEAQKPIVNFLKTCSLADADELAYRLYSGGWFYDFYHERLKLTQIADKAVEQKKRLQ